MRILLAVLVLVGCSKGKSDAPGGSSAGAPSAPAGAASAPASNGASELANKVAKLTEVCALLPTDMVKRLVPDGGAPQSERYPLHCSVYGKQAAIEIAFDTGPSRAGKDGERFSDIAEGGLVERLTPNMHGDVYVTIGLGIDDQGNNHNLHVGVNGFDGKDHLEDARALAREVLARIK